MGIEEDRGVPGGSRRPPWPLWGSAASRPPWTPSCRRCARRPRPGAPDLTQLRPCVVAAVTATRPRAAAAVAAAAAAAGLSVPSVGPPARPVSSVDSSVPSVRSFLSLGRSVAASLRAGNRSGEFPALRGAPPGGSAVWACPRAGAWPACLRGSLAPGGP